jgi:short-subunit dehydrogenase
LPLDAALDVMHVNNDALVRLTHAAVLRMLEIGRGGIVQISSMAAAGPRPQQAVYAASKAFVSSFGQALFDELADTPVTCTTVLPGFTRTRYFARVGLDVHLPDDRWMTPAEVARISLAAARRGDALVVPGVRNRWKMAVATPFPSLAFGSAKRHIRQALYAARRIQRRAGHLVDGGP